MSDLRQGVTPTQHAVLDRIEQQAAIHLAEGYDGDFQSSLQTARLFANVAERATALRQKYEAAISAAAMLIDAADEIARLLGPQPDAIRRGEK